jgi:transcriptional regulator with GAF, ATPase, and Fis domain
VEDVLIVDRDDEASPTIPSRPQEKSGASPTTPTHPQPKVAGLAGAPTSLADKLDSFERTVIARALAEAGGNVADAARKLHTDRPNLYRRMKRLGINATRI